MVEQTADKKNAQGNKIIKGSCPLCKKDRVAEFRPFCSRGCKNIDLNRWLSNHYTVPGEPVSPTDESFDE